MFQDIAIASGAVLHHTLNLQEGDTAGPGGGGKEGPRDGLGTVGFGSLGPMGPVGGGAGPVGGGSVRARVAQISMQVTHSSC